MSIQDDVNNFNSSNTASDFVLLAAQIDNCTTNRSVRVPTASCLPDLACGTVAPGTIIFVDDICVPVVAQIGCWSGLDNRELRNDFSFGLVWAWGNNSLGKLGDGTITDRSSPVSVIGGFTDWCQVSAGSFHTVAVRTNGTLWAWGCNGSGRLGDNTVTSRSSPVSVIGGFTDWCQVSAGSQHTAAVRTNGTLWAWGLSFCGRLGDGTTTDRSSPVSVVGGFTDWCQVSTSTNLHSLGVRQNGTAWAWGFNGGGQLGDGTTTERSSPVSVVGGFTDWCQVSAGSSHSLGVRQNGTAWAWGDNTAGRLGDGTTTSRSSPVSVIGGFTDWCQVSSGSSHSLGVRQNGTAWAWGVNNGALGDGGVTERSSPVSVVGGFTDWCQVSAVSGHTAAVRQNGTLWAWGSNGSGRLGDGTTTNRISPVSVVGGFTDWCQVSAGGCHTAALRSTDFT